MRISPALLPVVILACGFFCLNAEAQTAKRPMQAFIEREKKQTEFVAVPAMWHKDNAPTDKVDKFVSGAGLLHLDNSTLQRFMAAGHRGIVLAIPAPGGSSYEIELARFNIFAQDFSAAEVVAGVHKPVSYTPGLYYRGVVKGIPNSVASFSFFNDEVYGIFSLPGVGNMVVVPNTLNGNKGNGQYIVYNDMAVKERPAGACATDQLPQLPGKALQKNVFAACKDVEFYIKADNKTYLDKGSNTPDVFDYITAAFNEVSTLYRNEGVYISIRHLAVNTTTDIYQTLPANAGDYLDSFGVETQNNLFGADLAMLLSTKHGNMGGVGWLDVICQPYNSTFMAGPYSFCNIKLDMQGFPTYSFDVQVMAHEPGHNLGVHHTHWCGWPNGAIDGCYALEGSCSMPTPQYPANGGTIMSYCHLVSGVGVNFTNGFGQYPGDALRVGVSNAACADYLPHTPVITANTTLLANRECTDGNGITYYMNDNNNADESDDRLILQIGKAGNNIGTVDDTGFEIKAVILPNLGSGNGTALPMPPGMPGLKKFQASINRYWQVKVINQPASQVEVIFPFTKDDINDVDGSVVGNVPLVVSDLSVYTVDTGVNPNPLNGFTSVPQSRIHLYDHGTAATAVKWASTSVMDTLFAHFKTDTLNGGTVFYTYYPVGINDVSSDGSISFYPNPATRSWHVLLPAGYAGASMTLYSIEGKLLREQELKAGNLNEVEATSLPAGLYYYHISGSNRNFTGILQKQ